MEGYPRERLDHPDRDHCRVAIGGFVLRDRLSSNAGDLAVGDCFDEPTASAETIEDVQHQPCTEAP